MPFPVRSIRALPTDWPPTLVVVIDAEEEFDWNAPFDRRATKTTNIAQQPLAQEVFERHGVVPTYAIDYPVATDPAACRVLKSIADAGRCEIGAHLHPWVNPPLSETVDTRNSFPGNLPPRLERDKLAVLTKAIVGGFGTRPTVYKAGRYGIGPATAGILEGLGYRYDVSVVPHADFTAEWGPDFAGLPAMPFLVTERLAAMPLSVEFVGALKGVASRVYPAIGSPAGRALRLPGFAARLGLIERLRLSPEAHELDDMIRLARAGIERGERYFMLTYHSSSLLPGATRYVLDEEDRRAFLATLDGFLAFFLNEAKGRAETVTGLGRRLDAVHGPAPDLDDSQAV